MTSGRKHYRFPHHTGRWKQTGKDGVEYQITVRYYVAVLRTPQQVFMDMVIEGPNGYRRELRGDAQVYPVILRMRAERHKQHDLPIEVDLSTVRCDLCRTEILNARSQA